MSQFLSNLVPNGRKKKTDDPDLTPERARGIDEAVEAAAQAPPERRLSDAELSTARDRLRAMPTVKPKPDTSRVEAVSNLLVQPTPPLSARDQRINERATRVVNRAQQLRREVIEAGYNPNLLRRQADQQGIQIRTLFDQLRAADAQNAAIARTGLTGPERVAQDATQGRRDVARTEAEGRLGVVQAEQAGQDRRLASGQRFEAEQTRGRMSFEERMAEADRRFRGEQATQDRAVQLQQSADDLAARQTVAQRAQPQQRDPEPLVKMYESLAGIVETDPALRQEYNPVMTSLRTQIQGMLSGEGGQTAGVAPTAPEPVSAIPPVVGGLPRVTTNEQYAALPPGTKFVDPDGVEREKPR